MVRGKTGSSRSEDSQIRKCRVRELRRLLVLGTEQEAPKVRLSPRRRDTRQKSKRWALLGTRRGIRPSRRRLRGLLSLSGSASAL